MNLFELQEKLESPETLTPEEVCIHPSIKTWQNLEQHPIYHPEGSVWQHTMMLVKAVPHKYRLHAFFHDFGKGFSFKPAFYRTFVYQIPYFSFPEHDKIGAEKFSELVPWLLPDEKDQRLAEEIALVIRHHMYIKHLWRNLYQDDHILENLETYIGRFQRRAKHALSALEAVCFYDRFSEESEPDWFIRRFF